MIVTVFALLQVVFIFFDRVFLTDSFRLFHQEVVYAADIIRICQVSFVILKNKVILQVVFIFLQPLSLQQAYLLTLQYLRKVQAQQNYQVLDLQILIHFLLMTQ